MFTEEEKKVLDVALQNAISGCARSSAKAGLSLVKEAYAKQAMVLSECRKKINESKVSVKP